MKAYKSLVAILILVALPSSTSEEIDIDTTVILTSNIAYRYGMAAAVGNYSKILAENSINTAYAEATKFLKSSEVRKLVCQLEKGRHKELMQLAQDSAIEIARGTFKNLGFNCTQDIKQEWK